MKAFVIEEDQVKQYVFGIVGAIILAFVLGYLLGNGMLLSAFDSRSVSGETPGIEEVQAPAENSESTDNAESQPQADGEAQEAENRAEDQQTAEKAAAEKAAQEKAAQEKAAREKAAAEKKLAQQRAAEKAAAERAAAEKAAAEKREAERRAAELKAQQQAPAQPVTPAPGDSGETGAAEPQADAVGEGGSQRYYSIQAGMFASKTNALSFIQKLASKNFEAYVIDFVSSSGAVKYNVRVGRFENREEARSLLREYQKSFTTPAYVVISQ